MSIEVMRQALEALEFDGFTPEDVTHRHLHGKAITALRAAIEQTEKQEPVAWMHVQGNYEEPSIRQLDDFELDRGWQQYPLYAAPTVKESLPVASVEPPRRVCSGCDKTNTDDSMWAVYCVDCWKQRQWVGLTEIEICDIEADELTSASSETFSFARAIEAKLKEKNGG
jgi:hypothetical protein